MGCVCRHGLFRAFECTAAGTNNDQRMLIDSAWNAAPGALVDGQDRVGGDSGYWSTANIKITKPFDIDEANEDPVLQAFNEVFNGERSLIERCFRFLKSKCALFDRPWERNKYLLPIALSVALKLCNRFWRRRDNLPFGLQKIQDEMDDE